MLAKHEDQYHARDSVQAPVFAVVAFGVYAVASLLYGVATFRTVPEEAESLAKASSLARLPSKLPFLIVFSFAWQPRKHRVQPAF